MQTQKHFKQTPICHMQNAENTLSYVIEYFVNIKVI